MTRVKTRTSAARAALLAALLPCALPPAAAPLYAQAAVIEGDGAAALGVALRRLGTTKRVLMIAAHPDDENTALLAELALGDGADVAYLSLTRGEGGQNLIGPELQEGLGLIRTEELLAARRLDGASQFFSRAYDFGFSKSAAETFRHWPRDSILADVVEVIRRYRPDIIVSVFSGTPADGHGHHQAAGLIARDAFDAAADPARFPEHAARGLGAHRAHHLFQSLWRPPPDPPIVLATGDLDPLFGRSRHQIAMQSRSRHRSQDMGRGEPLGPQQTALLLLASVHADAVNGAAARSLFAGIDTTLVQHAHRAGAPAAAVELLRQYERVAAEVRRDYNPLRAHDLVLPLADALHLLARAQRHVQTLPGAQTLRAALAAETGKAGSALRQAAGVIVDVVSDTPQPVPGESFAVEVTVWNGGRMPVGLQRLELEVPAGWTAERTSVALPAVLGPNAVVRARFRVRVPADAAPTEAYFLRDARRDGMYAWSVADSLRALPFEPAPVRARLAMDAGAPFTLVRDAEFVDIDKAVGELRRPLRVVPAAAVNVEPRTLALAAGDVAPRTITVTVSAAAASGIGGVVHLDAPAGWRVQPASAPLRLERRGAATALRFTVTPPPDADGTAVLRARFETAAGTFARGFSTIDYPHIQPHALYHDADVRVSAFPVTIAPGLRVGYIEGAGDDGAAALRQLGATVEQLDAAALANADLAVYDAIVAGIRAYEVRTDLLAHNDRLLDYARAGGTFIVQYNKYEIIDGGFMPYPATMSRPHGRVTDHTAPVTLLAPTHPLLAGPNRITAADFDGWVQERGLYFLDTFDDRYTPLLAMSDIGEDPLLGGLVAARVGDGWYVYTGLALFRQLPHGVPGAHRLLANLVSLGRRTTSP